jgi:hypothetical protein
MAQPPNDDLLKGRRESASLIGLDADNLSPADTLRCDLISTLRLVTDDAAATVLDGSSADLGRLITAIEGLIKLLPNRELPPPEHEHADPRLVMWEIYKQMRERGELPLRGERGELPDEGPLQAKINEQAVEIERLRARLAGKTLEHQTIPGTRDSFSSSTATIDPAEADIVPPSELGVARVGIERGLDDPPRRSTAIIEGRANPPAASAAPPAKRRPSWDGTPHAKAWRDWHDAGGPGFDRWSNRNGA